MIVGYEQHMASSIVDALPRSNAAPRGQFQMRAHLESAVWHGPSVGSWTEFEELVAVRGRPLLARLDDYEDALLIAGCAWSGDTAIARLLKRTDGIADHGFGHDDELDGALLLAGHVDRFDARRHCFQTTYLSHRFGEYFEHDDFRLIFLLREPLSVVGAMLNSWKRAALDRLLPAGGGPPYPESASRVPLGASRLDKACAAYVESVARTAEIASRLGPRVAIVDYDELAARRARLLPQLFEFARVPFDPGLLSHLHGKSVHKGHTLAAWETALVEQLAAPAYLRARAFCTIGTANAF